MLQRSAIKLQTLHLYHGLPTSGRAKMGITTYYSYSHEKLLAIQIIIIQFIPYRLKLKDSSGTDSDISDSNIDTTSNDVGLYYDGDKELPIFSTSPQGTCSLLALRM